MRSFVSAVLGGLVVGGLFLLWRDPIAASPPSAPRGAQTEPLDAAPVLRRLEELDDRLRDVESRDDPVASPARVRTPVAASAPADLRRRVRALEAELADLAGRVSLTTFEPHGTGAPEDEQMAIEASISSTRNDRWYLGAMARIPLRARFLEKWPRHEQASNQLWGLVEDYGITHQLQKATVAIDRFGPDTGLPPWELDKMRLNAAFRDLDRIEIARRVAGSPLEARDRAWASLVLAKSLARTGQRAESLVAIESMVREFAGTEDLSGYVAEARKLREELAAR